ncbi:GspH/FimT family pseudopilin [Dyella tabacisoli]|uniref:Type II secretion system protein H n=1 Tax=Dyella tabacisoli TaxID=2282381 RepID=A0A369UK25_9GAMM|nr:GspH/FimT family pseudopilin [Dyella tabacisoli]RDD79940.1 prepilin-type N-terminal cleavage/methylation domain-containing protein [Dyella tabacisoli]
MTPLTGRPRDQRAFTLVELMVTVAVLAILTMVAVPHFRDLTRRHQISSVTHVLLTDLAYARTEAIMRAMFVSVCPSIDGTRCTVTADYAPGWLVYAYPVTLGANKAYVGGTTDFTLLRHTTARSGVVVMAEDSKIITYGQQGQLKRPDADVPIRLVICTATAENTAAVPGSRLEVSGSGSASAKVLALGDGCSPA